MAAAMTVTSPSVDGPSASVHSPISLKEALALRAEHQELTVIAGGTDLMVERNFGRLHPVGFLDLTRIEELRQWSATDGVFRIGSGVTFGRLLRPPFDQVMPALAQAARTVGSPQIRNRGTIGGNLGTASPAGDALPPLVAELAEVELASQAGRRRLPMTEFFTGPKRSVLKDHELIVAVYVRPSPGRQTFMKIGPRNAMVIAVASLALVIDDGREEIRASYGSAGPVPGLVRASFDDVRDFPAAVADACSPIDDVRGTAEYRRHALRVLTERALQRCRR
jgi:CO/xanthine dehydrogenase FAD-binding subunit